ncbi:MAG: 16S rRNA (guanine(527)-N(7))-methyltransferase RsmG [Bacillales bacterium]|nr:16S rRNA (guanine(527)-N(7))-methyltransferase RsmG [Bacillales bacterium]
MTKEEFISSLKMNNIDLNDQQVEQFEKYLSLLQEYNQVMNLTGITEENEVYEKHFFDSLLFSFTQKLDNLSLIDVGSGAGFPGIPLAICYPSCDITLLEPLTKRCNFLQIVVNALGLGNVTIINERSEDFAKNNIEKYDIVTARAVSRLNIILEITSQLVKVNGLMVALKGKIALEELKEAKNALYLLRFKEEYIQEAHLPNDDSTRYNIFLRKIGATPNKYPRNYGQIKKRPL